MEPKIKKNRIVQKILKVVKDKVSFFITAHSNPDGDTLGSELALNSWLRKLGKRVTIVNVDAVPEIYRFLPRVDLIKKKKKVVGNFDVGFILECSDPGRIGGIINLDGQLGLVISIDHHLFSQSYGDINWFDSQASATAEQVYQLIKKSGETLTYEEALCLYVGILTDTGKFQQKNTTAQTHKIIADLLSYGINPEEIHSKIYATKSYSTLRLLGLTLNSLKLVAKGKIAYQEITQEMYKRTENYQHDEETINYPLTIPQVEISILFREIAEEKNKVKVGFRSRNKVDVHKIAKHFGGGGHQNASGCVIEGNLKQVKNLVLNYIKKSFA
ncbi:MAG TPA: DHH family phosphoesterase [Elusimicrobia bacterium]|jgi:phosphoesterase RecJ-like protein|nr:DHH family phosphoesterase [Elusimicrobiota bacterium]